MDIQLKSHSESDTCRNVTFLLKWGCEIVRNSKIVTYSLYIVPYMIVIQNKGHFRSKGRHFRLKGHHFRWKGHHFRSKVITSSWFTQVWFSWKNNTVLSQRSSLPVFDPIRVLKPEVLQQKVQSIKCSPWVMLQSGFCCVLIRCIVFEILQL